MSGERDEPSLQDLFERLIAQNPEASEEELARQFLFGGGEAEASIRESLSDVFDKMRDGEQDRRPLEVAPGVWAYKGYFAVDVESSPLTWGVCRPPLGEWETIKDFGMLPEALAFIDEITDDEHP